MRHSLIGRKYSSLFVAGTIGMMVEYLVLLSDNIIAGQMIGEDGLAALTMITPFFNVVIFFTFILSFGTVVCMSTEIGKMDRRRANEYFSNGVIFCLTCGLLVTGLSLIVKNSLLHVMNVSDEIRAYAAAYFDGIAWLPILFPISNLIYEAIVNEGSETLAIVASVAQVIINVGLSVFLCWRIGILGIAIGTLVSIAAEILICSMHFLSKKNEIRFRFHVSVRDFIYTFRYSFCDASLYLYTAIFAFAANVFITTQYEDSALVVFCVVMNMQSLVIAGFDGVGNAMQPLLTVFNAEGNLAGLKKVMSIAVRYAIACGCFMTLGMLLFARPLMFLLGIEKIELIDEAIRAVHIFGLSSIFFALFQLYAAYCLFIGKIGASVFLNALQYLLLQLVLVFTLGSLFGLTGMWFGLVLTPLLALIVGLLTLKLHYRDLSFPLLLSPSELANWSYLETISEPKCFMEMVAKVEKFLRQKGAPDSKCLRAALLVEEMCIAITERNPDKTVHIACSTHLTDRGIELIFRDDGQMIDLTDVDMEVVSIQTFLSSSLLEGYQNRTYLRATSFNRSVFLVPTTGQEGI